MRVLGGYGLRFRTVEVVTEGDYDIDDAEWNYKDVPHLNQLHSRAQNVNGLTETDAEASINLQRFLGLRMPLVLTHYETGPYHHTYFFTMFVYVLVCETTLETTPAGRTRIVTNYAVGAGPFWMRFFPVVSWVLRRNYAALMLEDVPMRERRHQLRRWGYTFEGDGEPRNFLTSLPIEHDNVNVPDVLPEPGSPHRIRVDELTEDDPLLWGRSDHLGLRLERRGDELIAFPRLCPHEGACLDEAPKRRDLLECPWHGRRLGPLGAVALRDGCGVDLPDHRLSVAGSWVEIQTRTAHRTAD